MKGRLIVTDLAVRAATPPYLPKILALVMAALLWLHFSMDEEAAVEFRVVPRVQNVPASMELVPGDLSVSVRVQGPVSTLRKIAAHDIELSLNLARPDVGFGVHHIPVDASEAHLPFGTRIARITPTVVTVELVEAPAGP